MSNKMKWQLSFLLPVFVVMALPAYAEEICKDIEQRRSVGLGKFETWTSHVCLKSEATQDPNKFKIVSETHDGKQVVLIGVSTSYGNTCRQFDFSNAYVEHDETEYFDSNETPNTSRQIGRAALNHQWWIQTSDRALGFRKNIYKKVTGFYCRN